MNSLFQRRLIRKRLGTLLSFIVMGSLFIIALEWLVFTEQFDRNRHMKRLRNSDNSFAVFVLSDREAFDRRQLIRKTWALAHDNVFFVVGEKYCQYPPENRFSNTCYANNNPVQDYRLHSYLDKELMITKQIQDEQDVILVSSGDYISEMPKKVTESYKWALQNLEAEWLLHVDDSVDLEVDTLANQIETGFFSFRNAFILSSIKNNIPERKKKFTYTKVFLGEFQCGFDYMFSRCIALYIMSDFYPLFEYIYKQRYAEKIIADSLNTKSDNYRNLTFVAKGDCNMTTTFQLNLPIKQYLSYTCVDGNLIKTKTENKRDYTVYENPSIFLQSYRFDLIVKMVYAHFYAFETQVPKVIKSAYKEHLSVWNHFRESCNLMKKKWYDAKRPCVDKMSSSEFISSFHKTIDSIKNFGFDSSMSRIPVDKNGFLLNGAHRLAASIVLSKYATFDYQSYEEHFEWGYEYFKHIGFSESTLNLVMLEWMKIQTYLPNLKTSVSIVSVFSNNLRKDTAMRKIVKKKCSKDNGILYERVVKVSKMGARQLISHMYGQQVWLDTKIQQMLSKFKSSTFTVLLLFVYGKNGTYLAQCKYEIRKLYNDDIFKSTAHIPDTAEENLILAEMILNPNSLQFMNHAKDASHCKKIAKEIASRSLTKPVSTLPTIFLGRSDVMIDSGAVLGFFGLRKGTDVDILFLNNVDKHILGNRNGINIQNHAFISNSISTERAWGEDHLSEEGPTTRWDLFYDPKNYGYCYNIKFVSLNQLIRYKIRRNEPEKDPHDVSIMKAFVKNLSNFE